MIEFEVSRKDEASMFSFDYIERSKWIMQYVDSLRFVGGKVRCHVMMEHDEVFKEEMAHRGFEVREVSYE